ncbi:MAG: hypothetical protein M3N04_06730, partial [Actinomycetota bacterium]|nr:hypothetical protein [Actinomycetota bacterium]
MTGDSSAETTADPDAQTAQEAKGESTTADAADVSPDVVARPSAGDPPAGLNGRAEDAAAAADAPAAAAVAEAPAPAAAADEAVAGPPSGPEQPAP